MSGAVFSASQTLTSAAAFRPGSRGIPDVERPDRWLRREEDNQRRPEPGAHARLRQPRLPRQMMRGTFRSARLAAIAKNGSSSKHVAEECNPLIHHVTGRTRTGKHQDLEILCAPPGEWHQQRAG